MKRIFHIALCIILLALSASCSRYDQQTTLTKEEINWIAGHEDVRLGVSLHYPPYEMYGLKDDYQGLSADYIRLINEKTGLNFIPVRFRNRHEVMRALKEGRISVVAAVEMTDTRREYLDFTQPYVNVPAAIITRKEFKDDLTLENLNGMRIGVTVSPEFTRYMEKRYPGSYTIVPTAGGYIGGLRSLAVGDIDALICDMALASRYIANARISNLRIAGITNYTIDLRIASLKRDPVLGHVLRKGLAMIMPHERKVIEEEWLSLHYQSFWTSWKFWAGLLVVLGIGTGIIVLVLFWNRSLQRQVAQRTLALSAINKVLFGSLACPTVKEVMLRCLREARRISPSDTAFWGVVSANGELQITLIADAVEGGDPENLSTFQSIMLDKPDMEQLRSGEVVVLDIEQGRDGVQLVIAPLHPLMKNVSRVIAVARWGRCYTPCEINLLTEVFYAFEEALERKQTEISLYEKERQLQRVQRMDALGTLAGGIAHDFNNILGVIVANAEMVNMFHVHDDEAHANKIGAILAAANRGRDLVSQIQTFTRNNPKKAAPLLISPILKETVNFLQASLPASITIEYSITTAEPPIKADPTQMHQVLMNLCTNAAQAMEEHGGTLFLALRTEEIRQDYIGAGTLEDGEYLTLEVRDTGVGIPPEILHRIFDPFFTTKGPSKGTGMGLAMVQRIVQTLDGNIEVHSEPGEGTLFRVFLPALPRDEEPVAANNKDELIAQGAGRILFIDDEAELTRSCCDFLGSVGYKVSGRTDSRAALELFRHHPDDFDLIITDYNMPGLSGDRLAEQILAEKPCVPIVMCSGYSHSFDMDDAASLGIREYLKKPISLRKLALTVRKYLRPDLSQSEFTVMQKGTE
ncbi:MAG: transporter substrate-binding domain-containing protein [Desulfovibrionaceae bacterium]|nr:transporter substrate-binding domain-containing protein [Desulfovibrionaceae bacterium]